MTLGIEAAQQQAAKTNANCQGGPKPMRVTARHIEPGGIGYGLGYTTLEGFFPLYNGWENWVVFLDGRGHVFNDGKPAANAGLGVRYLRDARVGGSTPTGIIAKHTANTTTKPPQDLSPLGGFGTSG